MITLSGPWVAAGAFAILVIGMASGFWAASGWAWDRGYKAAEEDEALIRADSPAPPRVRVRRTGTAAFLHPPEDVQAGRGGPQRADVAAGAQIPKPSPLPAPEVAHEWDGGPPLIVQEDPESLAFWRNLDRAAREARLAEDQALALTRPPAYAFPPWSLLNADPPTFEEEIAAMIANANADPSVRWLDQVDRQ